MAKIVITIEGGMIQGITTDSEDELQVCILDFDTDGQDSPEIETFYGGRKELCNIHDIHIGINKKFVTHYFNELEKVN